MKFKLFDWIALILVIIGALNWGLIGFFNFDLVKTLFGDESMLTRTLFALIGLSGLYNIFLLAKMKE